MAIQPTWSTGTESHTLNCAGQRLHRPNGACGNLQASQRQSGRGLLRADLPAGGLQLADGVSRSTLLCNTQGTENLASSGREESTAQPKLPELG
jgi:hypothetical protein